MKKIILSLALLVFTPHLLPSNTNEEMPMLTASDHFHLASLYNIAHSNPNFEKTADIDLDYYLNLLEKQIRIIEYKIKKKENKWSDQGFQAKIALSSLLTLGIQYILYYIGRPLWTGKFNRVNIDYNMLEKLSSLQFSSTERKKLDRIYIENIRIIFTDIEKPMHALNNWLLWRKDSIQRQLNNLSDSDLQKLNYLARSQAVSNTKMLLVAVGILGLAVLSFLLYEIIYHQELLQQWLQKRLDDTKDLYHRLLNEKICHSNKIRLRHKRACDLARVKI